MTSDYGYDLVLYTYDEEGYAEEGAIYLQLKASEKLAAFGDNFVFDIDLRDYTRWTREPMPVILILFEASKRRAYWIYVQRYFAETPSREPRKSAKTVRIRVPKRQVVNRLAIKTMRTYKQGVWNNLKESLTMPKAVFTYRMLDERLHALPASPIVPRKGRQEFTGINRRGQASSCRMSRSMKECYPITTPWRDTC